MASLSRKASALFLVVAFIACSGDDEKPSRIPVGAQPAEILIPGAAVLIGAGDIGVCGSSGAEPTARIVDSVLRADSSAGIPTAVFTAGDNAYPSHITGTWRYFERCFADSWGKPRILAAIRPSPGNHDYDGGHGVYFDYFGVRAGPRGKGYYSYDLGSWHILSLNSELYSGEGSAAEVRAQEQWVRDDLAAHRSQCSLAYFHRPLFSSGSYGSSPQSKNLWQILYSSGVDLVLNGHEHDYERFLPQTPVGARDSVSGIEQIIVGTGGADLRRMQDSAAPNSAARIHGRFGVLKLALGAGEYAHAFIDTEGRIWDPGRRRCH